MAGALSLVYGHQVAPISLRQNPSRPLLPFAPMMVGMSITSSSWASVNADVEAHLRQAIPMKQPLSVYRPMHHLTFTAPPSMAPAVCIAACELVGGHRDQAMAAASALHVISAALYAHEGLLASHGRTKPMIGQEYSPGVRLMIGDGMVSFGLELLAQAHDRAQNNSARILRAMIELTRAVGPQGVVDGKYYEMVRPSEGKKRITQAAEKNEGRFHACAAACGAILAGGNEDQIERLRNYGSYVGKIQGVMGRISGGGGGKENELMKEVDDMREKAKKELKDFEGEKVETMYSFVDVNLSCA